MSEGGPYCACSRVRAFSRDYEDGTKTAHWRCEDCSTEYVPAQRLLFQSEAVQRLESALFDLRHIEWWKTYRAALTGFCSVDRPNDKHADAKLIADRVHGELSRGVR